MLIVDHPRDVLPALHRAGVRQENITFFSKAFSSWVPMEGELEALRPDYLVIVIPEAANNPIRTAGVRKQDLAARCRRRFCRLIQ